MPDGTLDHLALDGAALERRTPFGDNPVVGARGAKTQRKILSAALEVFREHGYHDSRIEQITEAAGCSRPTFYQYFSSKEDLFRSLASHVGRRVVEMTERLGPVTPDADGRAAVRQWLGELTEFYDAYAPVFTAFSSAVRSDEGLAGGSAVVSASFGRALMAHVALGRDDERSGWRGASVGRGRAVSDEVVASVAVTMIVRANLLRRGSIGMVGRRRFIESLAALVHRVLVGPVAGLDGDRPEPGRIPVRIRAAATSTNGFGEGVASDGLATLTPQGRQMRARLMEAGIAVFPVRGYHDTRVDDIVEAASASHGSFYRYFESKEDLFGAIAADAASQLIDCLDRFPASGGHDELRDWLRDWFGVYARHGSIIALWREMEFTDPVVRDVTRQVADAVLGRLYRVLAERGVGDPLVAAMALVGLVETVPHHALAFGYFDEDAAIAALVIIIRRGFLGVPA